MKRAVKLFIELIDDYNNRDTGLFEDFYYDGYNILFNVLLECSDISQYTALANRVIYHLVTVMESINTSDIIMIPDKSVKTNTNLKMCCYNLSHLHTWDSLTPDVQFIIQHWTIRFMELLSEDDLSFIKDDEYKFNENRRW